MSISPDEETNKARFQARELAESLITKSTKKPKLLLTKKTIQQKNHSYFEHLKNL